MEVKVLPNYADNPLVCGPRYMQSDFRCSWATHLGLFSSGVLCAYLLFSKISFFTYNITYVQCIYDFYLCHYFFLVLGINDGTRLTFQINTARLTRAFKVHGLLGKATDTYFWHGKTVEKATFGHVTREKIDKVVAHMQAAHQKTMYQ